MPDTLINPYNRQSPIGAALANFSRALTSGPTEAENVLRAEAALKLKREREGVTDVASVFRSFGQDGFDRNRAMSSAVIGGYDPKNLAELERYGSANSFGAADPRTTNAFVGAGGAYSSTVPGFREAQATEMAKNAATVAESARQFNAKPLPVVGPNGMPVFATNETAVGQRPVVSDSDAKGTLAINNFGRMGDLPPAEQRYIGATGGAQPTPRNYIASGQNFITYDGKTDARTGQPLPGGGYIASPQGSATDVGLRPTVQGNIQAQGIANAKFKNLLKITKETAQADPMNFGVAGFVKGTLQDVGQLGQNVAQGLGYTGINDALADTQKRVAQSGVNPALLSGVFDRRLGELHTLADVMVFSAAEALASQQGRSVSDKDVQMFKSIVGDPREWMMSQDKYISKLDIVERIVDSFQSVNDQSLRGGAPAPAAPAAPGASPLPTPQAGAPGAPPVQPQVQETKSLNGKNYVKIGGQWFEQ